ncbi:Prp18 domain-containing protein [Cladorrhinum sp. PSN332]|nr:Prp18 domain-containing protein [Cladorrhinum sp. PSN332]
MITTKNQRNHTHLQPTILPARRFKMDFASLMSKEIAKAKGSGTAATNNTKSSTSSSSSSSNSDPKPAPKFISRREAEEARKAAYLAEQKAIEEQRLARVAAKRKREEEAAEEARLREEKRQKLAEESRTRREAKAAEEERARRKRLGLPEIPPSDQSSVSTPAPESDDELDSDSELLELDPDLKKPSSELTPSLIQSKLRARGEPATLFGESDSSRLKRYKSLLRPTSSLPTGPIPTALPPLEESRMKIPPPTSIPPKQDKKARRYLFRQLTSYFNMVLREWESALAKENNQDTLAGQQAAAAMISSKDNMRPLFRLFEKHELDESVLEAIVEIVNAAQQRRYVDANDGYLRLSIGKAAWPIGVTMVGIHERSAREKLHNGERGHIMGSEVTRKYLQSIKRCLTFAQVRWPPEDIRQLMG